MRAATWQGVRDVRIEEVPDPTIEQDTDAIIRVTSSGLCGSDLHLYEVLSPFMTPGDILGHEPMGIVEALGSGVTNLAVGPMPMLTLFDKQIQLRMGQANVKHWVDDILPLLTDDDPLGVDTFASHHISLDDLPDAYETFQKKDDGAFKYVVNP